MNRIINKEYLIDLTLHSLQVPQPTQLTKVKCEVHYTDDCYLKIQLQPPLKDGIALFCDQRLRMPFSPQIDLVFKLVKANKKQSFLGHFCLEIEKMLNQKQYSFSGKSKLQETNVWVDLQCRIIDKQLLCESDTEQPELQTTPQTVTKSTIASVKLIPRHKYPKPLSQLNSPFGIAKKSADTHIPLSYQQFAQALQEAQDILTKRQIFQQRHSILKKYARDKKGRLRTPNILSLENRLLDSQQAHFILNTALYVMVGVIAFILGFKL